MSNGPWTADKLADIRERKYQAVTDLIGQMRQVAADFPEDDDLRRAIDTGLSAIIAWSCPVQDDG